MANRTVHLPDDLDEASRRLNLNLPHLVQDKIGELATDPVSNEVEARSKPQRTEPRFGNRLV